MELDVRQPRRSTPHLCLSLPRVVALIGGFGLVCAFFMPWFGTQNLLLSGQFLHQFLATPSDLRRFVPGSSGDPAEGQFLRALVDLFPACGVIVMVATVVGGLLARWRGAANVALGLSGLLPLLAWAAGIGRLPTGAVAEVGLWLIVLSASAVLLGLGLEVADAARTQP